MAEKISFDVTDKKIIYYLSNNARLPLNQLAKLVGKSKDSVRYRISRLQELDVIRGFIVVVDPIMLGHQFYQVFFRFQNLSLKKEKQILKFLTKLPETNQVWKTSGEWDAFILVDVRNPLHFNEVVMKVRNKFSPYINEYFYNIETKEYKFRAIADAFFEGIDLKPLRYRITDSSFEKDFELKTTPPEFSYGETVSISETELKLLLALDEDPRQSLIQLAKKTGLAKDTIKKMIRQLIANKKLDAFWPWVNANKLGFEWFIVFLRFKNISREREADLQEYLKNNSSVLRAVKLVGNYDVLISFNVKDLSQLHKQIKNLRIKFSDIILSHSSLLLEEELKFNVTRTFANSEKTTF